MNNSTRPIRLIELCDLELLIKVDSLGNVYTLDKTNIRRNGRVDNRRGRQIRPTLSKGYYRVTFSNKGKRKTYNVHRLVAMAFLDDYSEELQVNHIDGNKLNNSVDNLEMITGKENVLHSIKTGLKPKMLRDEYGRFLRKVVM